MTWRYSISLTVIYPVISSKIAIDVWHHTADHSTFPHQDRTCYIIDCSLVKTEDSKAIHHGVASPVDREFLDEALDRAEIITIT